MVSDFIFDLDGTLYDCAPMSIYSFREALSTLIKQHRLSIPDYSDDEIVKNIGLTPDEIGRRMLPDKYAEYRQEFIRLLMVYEGDYVLEGKGHLFPGIRKMLETIKSKGVGIYLASNCTVSYMQLILEHFGLLELFDKPYCIEMIPNGTHKGQIVGKILNEHGVNPSSAVMIGDRASDIEAGSANGLTTIGCLYGIGSKEELQNADYMIETVDELSTLLLRMT